MIENMYNMTMIIAKWSIIIFVVIAVLKGGDEHEGQDN